MGNMLGRAIALAATVHEGQVDKGGEPYILHPMRIMMRLRTTDVELRCIAMLHDTIEDSKGLVTLDTLREAGFSERVITALDLLTHREGEPYETYILRISTNRDAIRVKKEDLKDNSDLSRMKGVRTQDFDRVQKYNKAYWLLCNVEASMNEVGY